MTKGAIAAGHSQTAEAGVEILRQGGNAFDAALAAFLAAFVVESMLTSPGGGGFLLARTAEGHTCLFDFFTQTPRWQRAAAELDFYPVDVNFGDALQRFQVGLGAIAVPGNLAGVFHVHQRLGRLPFEQIVEPAIHYAEHGVAFDTFQAYCLQILAPIVTLTPAGCAIYKPQGQLLQAGDTLYNRNLGETLKVCSRQGARLLYEGELAHQLVHDCQQQGGHLQLEDLRDYSVIERSPFRHDYRGLQFLTNPPPSSGGLLIAFALGLLAYHPSLGTFGSPMHLRSLVQAMRSTNSARQHRLDGFLHDPEIGDRFVHHQALHHYATQAALGGSKWGSTTHISVLDADGNIASITSSNGEGCGYVIPDTGIMLNNMLGEADLNPQGFHNWPPNQRLSSMMAPSLVLQDDRPLAVLGSGGSNRIRTAILQVLLNLLEFGLPAETAVQAPRLHWEDGLLNWEPGFNPDAIATCLQPDEDQLPWTDQNMFFGGVHTLVQSPSGEILGAGDPRRNGVFQSHF